MITLTVIALITQIINVNSQLQNNWNFNGNYLDSVGSAHLINGVNNSLVNDRFGIPNSALSIVNGYMKIPPGVYFSGSFSIISWVYYRSFSNPMILECANLPNLVQQIPNDSIIFNLNNGKLYIEVTVGGNYIGTGLGSQVIQLNTWYHVAVTYNLNQGNQINMFVNGVVVGTSTSKGPPQNIVRNHNWIGRSNWNDVPANAIYDEIRIYSGALNSSQILNDFQVSSIAPSTTTSTTSTLTTTTSTTTTSTASTSTTTTSTTSTSTTTTSTTSTTSTSTLSTSTTTTSTTSTTSTSTTSTSTTTTSTKSSSTTSTTTTASSSYSSSILSSFKLTSLNDFDLPKYNHLGLIFFFFFMNYFNLTYFQGVFMISTLEI